MTGSSLAVVTVSYYSGDHLAGLIDSVRKQTEAPIFVANNAVDDDLHKLSAPNLHVVSMAVNVGYGGAVNAAVSAAGRFDWYLVVNPDVTLDPHAISRLLEAAAADRRAGVLGPLIRLPSGEIYPSARRLPSLRNGMGHALLGSVWRSNPWTRAYHTNDTGSRSLQEVGWLSGSCMLIRGEAFESVSGFDERFFMYFEDVDLCARIAQAGWRILYVPESGVVHAGGHATLQPKVSRSMRAAHHESAYLYLSSRYRGGLLAPLRLALRLGLQIRARIVR